MKQSFKIIDISDWKRREHFQFFQTFANPIFGVTTEIDVTKYYKTWKKSKTLTAGLVHSVASAANCIPEFKQRIRGEEVIEWNIINPSVTVLSERKLFQFCLVDYHSELEQFVPHCQQMMKLASQREGLLDPRESGDGSLYMSVIPWFHFSALTHPILTNPPDSIPRIAIGKCQELKNGQVMMPLNCQVHHGLIDAYHLQQFFELVQSRF